MAFKGFPKAMIIACSVIAAILVAEAAFAIACGLDGTNDSKEVPALCVQDSKLCAEGQPVAFHGISFGWHNLWPRFYNAGAVKNLHDEWGCRIFRAAIGSDAFANKWNPGCAEGLIQNSELAYSCLYNVVDAAIAEGCYVIVDWHSHMSYPEQAKEFFATVAAKYAGVPNVIYELFNEPVCFSFEADRDNGYGDLGNPEAMAAYWKHLKAYAEPIIKAIADASGSYKPLILMGCPSWDQRIDLPAADPIEGYDNLMYTVHFYAATHKQELRDACDKALVAGTPIFISECAGCDASGDGAVDIESWNEWTAWADANGISMMSWSVSDKNETCSMFLPEAASEGPWADDVIKPWGQITKNWIK